METDNAAHVIALEIRCGINAAHRSARLAFDRAIRQRSVAFAKHAADFIIALDDHHPHRGAIRYRPSISRARNRTNARTTCYVHITYGDALQLCGIGDAAKETDIVGIGSLDTEV